MKSEDYDNSKFERPEPFAEENRPVRFKIQNILKLLHQCLTSESLANYLRNSLSLEEAEHSCTEHITSVTISKLENCITPECVPFPMKRSHF